MKDTDFYIGSLTGFIGGALIIGLMCDDTIYRVESSIHPQKAGCEYVEKTECKQVWVKSDFNLQN